MNRRMQYLTAAVPLAGLILLAPIPVWGACSEEAQGYYAKGREVRQKYGSFCADECQGERAYFFRRAVELCPTDAKARTNLGDALEKLGRYREAEVHYAQAIQLDPQLAVAHFSLGDLYFSAGEYARAIQAYDRGLQLDPDDAVAKKQRNIARCLEGRSIPDRECIEQTFGILMGVGRVRADGGNNGEGNSPIIPISIPFAFNDDRLLPAATAPLQEMGGAMKRTLAKSPSAAFLIEGHTDLRGTEEYNLDLSRRRARRVAQHLVEGFQIPPDRLGIRGYGKTRPRDVGTSEAAHARNRRVEFSRLEVGELRSHLSIELVQESSVQRPSPLTVDVAVFRERPGASPEKLADGAVLRSGESYRVFFQPYQTCYVDIFQIDASGKLFHLFPNPDYGTRDNLVQARTASWAPGKATWFELDQTRGIEEIYVLVSRVRRDDIADLLRRSARPEQGAARPQAQQELTAVWKVMGVERVRAGEPVAVATKQGTTTTQATDRLERAGVSLAYKFAFRHE